MKDPFPPARQAGILAIAASHQYFTLQESACRLLPALCAMTIDPEKLVRDQVSTQTWKANLKSLETKAVRISSVGSRVHSVSMIWV